MFKIYTIHYDAIYPFPGPRERPVSTSQDIDNMIPPFARSRMVTCVISCCGRDKLTTSEIKFEKAAVLEHRTDVAGYLRISHEQNLISTIEE